jgi:hypothetical protein
MTRVSRKAAAKLAAVSTLAPMPLKSSSTRVAPAAPPST